MTKVRIVTALLIVFAAISLAACDVRQSTESLAAAYISAAQKMDSVKILEFSDYKGEYENGNLKKAAKANLDLSLSKLSREKKLELKSYKFKCYEKIDSIETESAEEIDGETIIITSKEIGKITITYKKNGRGEVLEKSETVTFFKVKDKWYLGTANAHASSDVALRLLCILGCVHEVRSASAASQLLPAYVAPSIRY